MKTTNGTMCKVQWCIYLGAAMVGVNLSSGLVARAKSSNTLSVSVCWSRVLDILLVCAVRTIGGGKGQNSKLKIKFETWNPDWYPP